AELVERGVRAFDGAVTLHQVHAFEWDVEARILGVTQQHEFAAAAFGLDQAQAFELPDAMVHVDDVISRLEFREVGKKAAGANLAAGAFNRGGDVEEIGVAIESDFGVGKGNALGKGGAHEDQRGGFGGVFGSESCSGFFSFAQHVRDFVFAADIGVALEFAEAGGSEVDGAAGSEL